MVGERDILLLLIELLRINQLDRILLRVDSTLLKRGVKLIECKWGRRCAHALPPLNMQVILHNAESQAFEILGAINGLIGRGLTETVDTKAAQIEVSFGILLTHNSQEVLIFGVLRLDIVNVVESHEQIIDRGIGNIIQNDGVRKAHSDVAVLHHLTELIVAADRVARINIDGKYTV